MPRGRAADVRQRDACARDWCFTINRPNYNEEEEDDFRKALEDHSNYWIYGRERGENGTRHWQGFVQLKTKARLRTVKTQLPFGRAHLEKRRGTPEEAAAYCKKEGDFVEGGVRKTAGKSGGLQMAVENIHTNMVSKMDLCGCQRK